MLGARAALGRLFGPEDAAPGTGGTAVLGHATWMRRFGGDPTAVGRTLVLNGEPYQVIGVLAEGFDLPREVMPTLGGALHSEVVVPLTLAADAAEVRNREDYNIVGKLKPGVSRDEAQAEMDRITARPAPRPSRLLSAERRAHASTSCRSTSRWSATFARLSSC